MVKSLRFAQHRNSLNMAKKNRKRVLPERIKKAFTKRTAFNCW
jgi:hypothetical protein